MLVRLFGVPAFAGNLVFPSFPDKGFHLIARLCAEDSGSCPREYLARLLWDAVPVAQARVNLRQLLARIKRHGPNEPILLGSNKTSVFLLSAARIDLLIFLTAARETGPSSDCIAFSQYAGTLLETTKTDATAFSKWLEAMRSKTTNQMLEIGKRVIKDMTRTGTASHKDITAICRKLLGIAPDREDVGRQVINAYLRIGATDLARTSFETLKASVLASHKRELTPETLASLHRPHATSHQGAHSTFGLETVAGHRKPRLAILRPRYAVASAGKKMVDYLVDGLIDELAFELARYRSFVVLAPFSSFSAPDDFGLPRDNSLLRADYVVAGDVLADARGRALRLHLTHVESREIVWAGEFPFAPDTLDRCLHLLAQRIVFSVASELERHKLESLREFGSPSAMPSFLAGRALQSRCDLPNVRKARSHFLRATALEPRFSQAHARIAETLYVEWILCGGMDADLLNSARRRALRAIELEPDVATGHWVSGAVALYQRQFDLVEDAFEAAELLCPHDPDLLLEFGDALSHLGQHDLAEQKFIKAVDLNPMPPDRYWWFGASIAFNRLDFKTAVARSSNMRSIDSALGLRTACNALVGNLDTARYWARRLKQALPGVVASDLVNIAPDREGKESNDAYIEGLRLAGIK